ncbi:phBC6A51 family helix-turn-helix protein [Virgibacillus salexigens]|uniref:phBC6A51 family helix-turn-helix protein n=1 Tax=Virgibacillus salexigens TaxID=61016 RepID=UPI00190E2973|nr:phBC6A51 family helix-turn-helix protein [Virgibacillus salexigens]
MGEIIKDMDAVPVPTGLTERQQNIAKAWVDNELNDGLTVQEFCRKNSLSSATLSKWNKDIDFSKYVQDLKGEVISSDEIRAYEVVKKHILERVNSANPSDKDIQMFTDHFQYVVKYEQHKAMEKLGIAPNGQPSRDNRTLQEKKEALFRRLKTNNNTGEIEDGE